jgi:hypothetical protein
MLLFFHFLSCSTSVSDYEALQGVQVHSIRAHPDCVTALVADASGRYVVSGGHDAGIRTWDLCTQRCVHDLAEEQTHRKKFDEVLTLLFSSWAYFHFHHSIVSSVRVSTHWLFIVPPPYWPAAAPIRSSVCLPPSKCIFPPVELGYASGFYPALFHAHPSIDFYCSL